MAFRPGAASSLPGPMAFSNQGQRQSSGTSLPGFPSLPQGRPMPGHGQPSAVFMGQGSRAVGGVGSYGMAGSANGLTGHTPTLHQTSQPEPSLDPSDFPALGACPQSSSMNANSQSSYASHLNTPGVANGPLSSVTDRERTAAALLAGQRNEFTPDDFPALDGGGPGPGGVESREAREQASAAAALTAQIARLSTAKGGAPSESDKQNYATKLGVQSQSLVGGPLVGPTPHLSNGVAASQPISHPPNLLQPQPQSQQQASLQHHSPAPPTATSRNATAGYNASASAAAQGPGQTSGMTPLSQHQSLGGGDTSSQPTPSLDTAASVASHPSQGSLPRPSGVPQTPVQQVLFSPADRFGLLGLLHIIKHADSDKTKLALGMDLQQLGLDLQSGNPLYPNLMTPWSESAQVAALHVEPEFHLPSCYSVHPQPVEGKLANMHDETIFWIFYHQPRDRMQELAAAELYKRNWRYHKELQQWLTKESGVEPVEKTSHFERGHYVFFDPTNWVKETRLHTLIYAHLEQKPSSASAAQLAAAQAAGQVNHPVGDASLQVRSTSAAGPLAPSGFAS